MLKLTLRRFAGSALATAFALAGASLGAQQPGITPGDSQPAPRRDTPRSNTSSPAADSRVGGALAPDAKPFNGAEVGDDIPGIRDADPDVDDIRPDPRAPLRGDTRLDVDADTVTPDFDAPAYARTTFAGLVTGVSDGRLAVQMTPPRVPVAMEQVFKVSDLTPVVVNGDRADLSAIREGNIVRVTTYAGDPEMAAKVVAVTPPTARRAAGPETDAEARPVPSTPSVAADGDRPPAGAQKNEDQDPNFDVYPDKDTQPVPPRRRPNQPGGPRVANRPVVEEEITLGLGLEVYDSPGEGVLVTDIVPDGPAALAGVEIGDFIMRMNAHIVTNPAEMNRLLAVMDTPAQINLTLWRNGQPSTVAVRPVATVRSRMSTVDSLRGNLIAGRETYVSPLLGVNLRNHERSGIIVAGVDDRNETGLLDGDVILSVNGQPVDNRDDLAAEMELLAKDSQEIEVVVRRNDAYESLHLPVQRAQATEATRTEQESDGPDAVRPHRPIGTRKSGDNKAGAPATSLSPNPDKSVDPVTPPTGEPATRDTDAAPADTAPGGTVSGGKATGETDERGQRTQGFTSDTPGPE